MAEELLQARHDFKKLGKNWTERFLNCHPILQSKYSYTLDQDRFLAQNRDSIQQWFNLYWSIKIKHGILNKDMYNIDENGYMMGIAESSKVVFLKYQKQKFMNQAGNREWATFIEVIGTTGHQLLLFVILKGKKWKDDWYPSDMEKNARISLNENGWADNKLCMEWIKDCFQSVTKSHLWGKYQMLIVDGHASQMANKFIQFTQEHKIRCLYLPANSTCLLQPLDVGVFDLLKRNYKTLLAEKTRFTTYNIDKVDFISLI